MKGKTKKIIDVLITYCLLIVVAFVFFFPCLWLVLSSLSSTGNLYSIPGFFPSGYSLDSFIDLFTDTAMYDYPHWLLNTLIVAVANCILSTLLIILTAYVISRFEFKLRRPLMKGALILGMFPSFMSMTIIYILMTQLQLINNLLGFLFNLHDFLLSAGCKRIVRVKSGYLKKDFIGRHKLRQLFVGNSRIEKQLHASGAYSDSGLHRYPFEFPCLAVVQFDGILFRGERIAPRELQLVEGGCECAVGIEGISESSGFHTYCLEVFVQFVFHLARREFRCCIHKHVVSGEFHRCSGIFPVPGDVFRDYVQLFHYRTYRFLDIVFAEKVFPGLTLCSDAACRKQYDGQNDVFLFHVHGFYTKLEFSCKE